MPDLATVVLCEDLQSHVVLYRYLKARGYPPRRIRIVPYPAGAGSGSQHVREHYLVEVRVQRRSSVSQVLVVHVDADNLTVAERQAELAKQLSTAGEGARGASEPIVLVIPKWELETWIAHYQGAPNVIETEKAPKFRGREAEVAVLLVTALESLVGGASVPVNLPSLGMAIPELKRLP